MTAVAAPFDGGSDALDAVSPVTHDAAIAGRQRCLAAVLKRAKAGRKLRIAHRPLGEECQ